MVTEILETARLKSEHGQLNREKTDLVKLIQGSCLAFKGHAPGIRFESSTETCQAFVDANRIEKFIGQCAKYSNAENAPVEISINTTDDKTHIEIQDHGQCIPKEAGLALDLIFEPFYRNDKYRNKKTGGYGLGLSLCKTIIEEHGGTISVKSKFGEGATFCLNLPNSPQPI